MKIKKYSILTIFALLNFELNAVIKAKNKSPIKECQSFLDAKYNRTWGDRFTRSWQRNDKIIFFNCLMQQLQKKYFEAEENCRLNQVHCRFDESNYVTSLVRQVYFWLNEHYPREHKQFIKDFAEQLRNIMKQNYYGSEYFNKIIDPIKKAKEKLDLAENLKQQKKYLEDYLNVVNEAKSQLDQMKVNWFNFQEAFRPYLYKLYGQDKLLKYNLRQELQKYLRCACIQFNWASVLTNLTEEQIPYQNCEGMIDNDMSHLKYETFKVRFSDESDNICGYSDRYFR